MLPHVHDGRTGGVARARAEPATQRHPQQCAGGPAAPGGHPVDLEEVGEILKDIVATDRRASEIIRRLRALVKKEQPAFARSTCAVSSARS